MAIAKKNSKVSKQTTHIGRGVPELFSVVIPDKFRWLIVHMSLAYKDDWNY
jgi:hypothetical protein